MKLRRFSQLSVRNLGARPQRTTLTAIGIVLGVGIVFGVITLSNTMSKTFTELYSKAYGAAEITVTAQGGNGTFDESRLGEIRSNPDVGSAAPRLSVPSSLILGGKGGSPRVESMRLFGVEPKSAAFATGFSLAKGRYPRSGAELMLDAGTAKAAGLRVGQKVRVGTPGGVVRMKLVGTLRTPGGSFGGIAFGMAPLRFVQKEFGYPHRISGVAVQAAKGVPVERLRKELDSSLGRGLTAQLSSTRTREANSQFQGFELALLFFAGTSLFVGAFLVFNALSMTVLERTRELGMLRALGATRSMIARSVITEAAALGVLGSIAGLAFGYLMARGLSYLFGRAFHFQIERVDVSPFALVSAVVIGVLITVLAALYPALRAGRVSPVEAMRSRSASSGGRRRGRVARLSPIAGVVLAGGGIPWTYYLAKHLSAQLQGLVYASGIAGVIAIFLGISLLVPTLVRPMAAGFSPLLRLLFGVEGRMASANATRNPGRTALTASALMIGIALVIAFATLGGSLLGSIRAYLDNSLGSDYVVEPTAQNSNIVFSSRIAHRIGKIPGVEETTGISSTVQARGGQVFFIFGLDRNYTDIFRINYASGKGVGRGAFSKLQHGQAIIGKQLARSQHLGVGSEVSVPSPKGTRHYRVAGIVDNDILGGGTGVYISKRALARDFNVGGDRFLAIKVAPGADRKAVAHRIKEIIKDYPQLTLYSNAEWKASIERSFEQQYVFFYAIMGVSVAVSAFGVVNTLSMSVFERTREIGILRAIGSTRLQVGRLIVDEGVVISVIGCLLGVALGSFLGYLFVRGTGANGFDISFYYPTLPALYAILSGLVIGVLAGLLPARTAARKDIVEAVQYE